MENRSSGFMSGLSAFGRGLFSGAISGALMAGIAMVVFPVLGISFGGGLWSALAISLSASLFSGIMNVYRDYTHRNQAASGQMREGHVAAASPGMVPVLVPAVAQDRSQTPAQSELQQETPTRNWVASLGKDQVNGNKIQQIMNDTNLTDKTRAAAILAEREARAAAPTEAAR
ncbi:MAG: hypothetical protein ACK5WQ_03420 [Alphaproteobacteria bacterium]